MIRWLRTDNVNIDQLSELVAMLFTAGLNTVAERHATGKLPVKTGHVQFAHLMSDPVAAIAAAFGAIDRDFTPAHQNAVLNYLANKPRAKHGTHDYTAEDWGYDTEALRHDAAPYMSTFSVKPES